MWLEIRFSFRFLLRASSLLIIRPAPPVVPQRWSDLVTRVPCVTVGGPRGTGWGEQIISLHAWYPCPTLPAPTTGPAPERPVQGEEQLQALENMTPIKLWRPARLTLHCLSPVVLCRKTRSQPRETNPVSIVKAVAERGRFCFTNNSHQIRTHRDPSRNRRMKLSMKSRSLQCW